MGKRCRSGGTRLIVATAFAGVLALGSLARCWAAVPAALAGEILPRIGAVPIVKDGRVGGAIRCGDGTGQQDHECAEAGAAAAGA